MMTLTLTCMKCNPVASANGTAECTHERDKMTYKQAVFSSLSHLFLHFSQIWVIRQKKQGQNIDMADMWNQNLPAIYLQS